MRACEVDRHLFCFESTHSLCVFDRFLDRINRSIGIDDHSFAKTACFGFSDANNFKESAFTWFAGDEGEIANLAVAPSARRHGIGAALLDASLGEARRRGVKQVYLEVRESNAAARALYERRGFSVVGRRKRYYRHPDEDALLLRRTIGKEAGK